MKPVGRLIQPYSLVTWDGENLSARNDGSTELGIMAQNVKIDLNSSQAPRCSFEFVPSPEGFRLFSDLKERALTKPISVTLGLMNLVSFTQQFRYVGMDLTTGLDPKIRVDAVGLLKGPFTDKKLNYAMEDKIPLKELPDFLLGKLKPRPPLSFVFTEGALEVIKDAEHQENQLQRSAYSILSSAIRPYGLRLDPGVSAFSNTISISVAPNGKKVSSAKAHVVGPGLALSLNRKQKFNLSASSIKSGTSENNPVSREQDDFQAAGDASGNPQTTVAETTTVAAAEGTSNPQNSAESRSTGSGSAQAQKARIDETKLLTTELTFTAPLMANFIAIAPRDFIMVPSLKGPGSYIEDWEVESVSYYQDDSGAIMVNVKANRPYIGDSNLASPETIEEVRRDIEGLKTLDDWGRFYWGQ